MNASTLWSRIWAATVAGAITACGGASPAHDAGASGAPALPADDTGSARRGIDRTWDDAVGIQLVTVDVETCARTAIGTQAFSTGGVARFASEPVVLTRVTGGRRVFADYRGCAPQQDFLPELAGWETCSDAVEAPPGCHCFLPIVTPRTPAPPGCDDPAPCANGWEPANDGLETRERVACVTHALRSGVAAVLRWARRDDAGALTLDHLYVRGDEGLWWRWSLGPGWTLGGAAGERWPRCDRLSEADCCPGELPVVRRCRLKRPPTSPFERWDLSIGELTDVVEDCAPSSLTCE